MWSLPLFLALATAQYIQMEFDIYRGNSVKDIHNRISRRSGPYFEKRDGSATMVLQNSQTFYMTELLIGSNGDSQGVLVDTGSSDLWIMSHDLTCLASSYYKKKSLDETFTRDKQVVRRYDGVNEARDDTEEEGEYAVATRSTDEEEATSVNKLGWSIASLLSTALAPIGGLPQASATASGTNVCTQYGSFNTAGSSSFRVNSSAPAFNIQYADGTDAQGFWGTDTVNISGTTVNNLSFAIANVTSSDVGVLGIGLPGLEVTNSNSRSLSSAYQYANLPLKLRQQGTINKAAYSVYLGRASDSTGTILFGAVDHDKYSGQLTTVPIINSYASLGYSNPIRLEVVVDSMNINSSSSSVSITSNSYGAVLDTGSTLSYFPTALLTNIASALGATYNSRQQAYSISCSTDSSASLQLNFSGLTINVPLSNLIFRSGGTCMLGALAQSSSSSYILFGDNVLRSMYAVFDLDDYEISLAQAVYTDSTNIEVIESSIPSAVRAASYSNTQVATSISEASATGTRIVSGSTSSSTSTGTGGGRSLSDSYRLGAPMLFLYSISAFIIGLLLI